MQFFFGNTISNLVKTSKEEPKFKETTLSDYKNQMQDLFSDKKKLKDDIDDDLNIIKKYNDLINCVNMMDSSVNFLDELGYAYKNAKNEDDFIDMSLKEQFLKETMNGFLDEPIDYKNVYFASKDIVDVKVRKIGSR